MNRPLAIATLRDVAAFIERKIRVREAEGRPVARERTEVAALWFAVRELERVEPAVERAPFGAGIVS